MRWSIRTKLAVIALLALVPLAVFFGFATQGLLLGSLDGQMDYMRAYILLEARRAERRNAGTLSALLAEHQAEVSDEARNVALLPAARQAAAGRAGRPAGGEELRAPGSGVDVLVVVNRAGRIVAGGRKATTDSLLVSPGVGPPLRKALAGMAAAGVEAIPFRLLSALVANPLRLTRARLVMELSPDGDPFGLLSNGLALIAAEPVREGGRVTGAVLAGYLLSGDRKVLAAYRSATGGAAAICLGGVRVTTTLPPRQGHTPGTRLPAYILRQVAAGGSYAVQQDGQEEGGASAWDYRPLANSSGQVVGCLESETPLSHLYGALREMEQVRRRMAADGLRSLLWRLAFAMVVAFILSGVVANGIAAPIRALRREVQRIAEGDYEQAGKTNIETGDEIEELAADFSVMAQRLREARDQERMALLGQMASSVVHDLRNPLTAIRGFAAMLADPATTSEERAEFLATIEAESERISGMLSDLLEFSRGREAPVKAMVALDDFVAETADLLGRDLKLNGVTVETRLASGAQVPIDRNRMARVLANLAGNARDAMPQGGTVTFATAREGKLALITVSDTGPGVPAEIRSDLFEPFRTYGKASGTGLGLAICRQIVTAHGGAITLEQEEGKGARFVITLPIPEAGENPAP